MPIAQIILGLIDLAKVTPELAAALEHLFAGGDLYQGQIDLVNHHAQIVRERIEAVAAADASKAG